MPLNIPGILVPFQLIFNPRIVLPAIVVKDIRYLDFAALHKAGYRGVVFDKDNCITRPHKDTIVPEIQQAWDECRKTFGEGNVLIVSNSAGTPLDPVGIQSEAVTRNTFVPVLRHGSFKPSYSCIAAVRAYFSSLQIGICDEELIVVGDRVFTDIVMANRMRRNGCSRESLERPGVAEEHHDVAQDHPRGPLAIWTTGIWAKEARVMRWFEKQLVNLVQRWATSDNKATVPEGQFVKASVPQTRGNVMEWLAKLKRS